MNKTLFFDKYDKQLTRILKELPVLEDLTSSYKKQAFILMTYAYFEGFVYQITKDFYNILMENKNNGKILNAHYNFCTFLNDKPQSNKDSFKKLWNKFLKIKQFHFSKDNNNLIDTNDNMGYEVFKYILFLLNICEHKNINPSYYVISLEEKQEHLHKTYSSFEDILNKLLLKRNDIAHGNIKILDEDFLGLEEIKAISSCVKTILRQLKEDLFDIIENEEFLLD